MPLPEIVYDVKSTEYLVYESMIRFQQLPGSSLGDDLLKACMMVRDVCIQSNHLVFKLESKNTENTESSFRLQISAIVSFLNNMYKGAPRELSEV